MAQRKREPFEEIPLLAELSRILREEPSRGRALSAFLREGLRHGRESVRPLVSLRRSFYGACVVLTLPLVALVAYLFTVVAASSAVTLAIVQAVYAACVFFFSYPQLDLVRGEDGRPFRAFGIGNTLTLLRILYAPSVAALLVFCARHPELRTLAALSYAGTALSDMLDGMFARALDQRSDFGRIYDPLGDQILNPVCCLALSVAGALPWWLTVVVLYRYWAVLVIGTLLYVLRGPFPIYPTTIGKLSGFVLGVVLGAAAIRLAWSPAFLPEALMLGLFLVSLALTGGNAVYLTGRGVQLRGRRPWRS